MHDKTSAFNRSECIDSTNFGKIYLAVAKAADENVELPLDVKQHLVMCPYCRKQVPTWQGIVGGMHLQSFLNSVVNDGLANRPGILKRKDGDMTYFFGCPLGDSSGGYIVVWDEQSAIIHYAEYSNAERFQEFSFKDEPSAPVRC